VSPRPLVTATSTQWALVQQIRTAIAGATVQLRERILVWTRDRLAPTLTLVTVLVITKVGPLTVRREFHVPPAAQDATVRAEEDELMHALRPIAASGPLVVVIPATPPVPRSGLERFLPSFAHRASQRSSHHERTECIDGHGIYGTSGMDDTANERGGLSPRLACLQRLPTHYTPLRQTAKY
jgi:hypothetical protein